MDEEHNILQSVIREFIKKEIQPISNQIETTGIPADLKRKLSTQGFMGVLAPSEFGGSGLDRLGYSILLQEIASESPSVAFHVLIQNSFVIRSLMKSRLTGDLINSISNGNISGTLCYTDLLDYPSPGKLTLKDGKIEGTLQAVINSKSDLYIVRIDENKFYAITEGFEASIENEKLGMRGLSLSAVKFSLDADKAIGFDLDASEILEDSYLPISAIALGIAKGALSKAIEYSKERSTFLHKLKDFQPLAFGMSHAYSQLEVLTEYMVKISQSEQDVKKELMLKLLSLEFAIEASKLALQVHGGYGYLMDFGVEKFYRDSMFLSAIGGKYNEERTKLSSMIFESKAGWI